MNLYRMALTENGLSKGYLQTLGIPKPSNSYKAYQTQAPQSTGGQKRLGYKNDSWQWVALTPTQANEICRLVESALSGAGVIYVTLPRGNGESAGMGWIDAYGVPSYPEIVQIQDAGVNGRVIQAVTLRINNITVVNQISTAVPKVPT